jgi:hypothetical protein
LKIDDDDKTKAIEPGYTARDVTKVPGWHGLVAWNLLFNNLTTGLFLFAAVGGLASPALLGRVVRVAYPVALVFLLTDLFMLVLDMGDPLRFNHMLRVFKAQFADVAGYVESHHLFASSDRDRGDSSSARTRPAATRGERAGTVPQMGGGRWSLAGVRIARLQGSALLYELATGLERRSMAGTFHGEF